MQIKTKCVFYANGYITQDFPSFEMCVWLWQEERKGLSIPVIGVILSISRLQNWEINKIALPHPIVAPYGD